MTPRTATRTLAPARPIVDFARPNPSPLARPVPDPRAEARVQPKATPRPTTGHTKATGHTKVARAPKPTGNHRSGSATWYCRTGVSACRAGYPGGMYAAAGPGLRVGSWRNRTVRVCGNGTCISVRLIDWCACGSGHLIDLYSDAFRRLAPLSSGAVRVTVSW